MLPFGTMNVPSAFQRRINKILEEWTDIFVVVYLDDILIYSKTAAEHATHVKLVLRALSEADMILNLEKCTFFATEVRYLGHIISKDGTKPDPRNIEKIRDYPTPPNITDVRGFNNLAGHYRRYVFRFADVARPLTDLQKGSPPKGSPIIWEEKEELAFNQLKEMLTSEPILRHAKIGEKFYIEPDSSQYCIGSELK